MKMKYLLSIKEYGMPMLTGKSDLVNYGKKSHVGANLDITGTQMFNTAVGDLEQRQIFSDIDQTFYDYDEANEIVKEYFLMLNRAQEIDQTGFDKKNYSIDTLTTARLDYMLNYIRTNESISESFRFPQGFLSYYRGYTVKYYHTDAHNIYTRLRERTGLSIEKFNEKLQKAIDRIKPLMMDGEIRNGNYAFMFKYSKFTLIIDFSDTKPNELFISTILSADMKLGYVKKRFTLNENIKFVRLV